MTAASFKALVDNAWFKLGARLLGWVAVPLLMTVVGLALTLRSDVNDTREFSFARAKDNEAFQAQTLANDSNTKAQLELLRAGQTNQGMQLANMAGVLAEMQRQQTAIRNAQPFTPIR